MIGEMRRKGGWEAPCSMDSQNRFADFASVLSLARLARHYVASKTGLFR